MYWPIKSFLKISKTLVCVATKVALLLVVNALTAIAQTNNPPLEGEAYQAADEAYAEFAAGDFSRAASKARASIVFRPDVLRLRLPLVDALTDANDLVGTRQAIDEADKSFPADPDLRSRQAAIRLRLAQQPSADTYKALEAGAAERAARLAVTSAPDVMAYRLLLLSSLLAENKLPDALQAATSAIGLDPKNYVPLVWRGYINQRMGDRKSAVADFDAALLLPDLADVDKKNITLIAADAALTSNDAVARLDAINQNLVFFPHIVVAANYDDSFARREAYGIGPGGSLRYWFGGSEYVAPPSYLELTLQYRFRIAGDSRAEGIFAQALANY
jgi:hypothetical protein